LYNHVKWPGYQVQRVSASAAEGGYGEITPKLATVGYERRRTEARSGKRAKVGTRVLGVMCAVGSN